MARWTPLCKEQSNPTALYADFVELGADLEGRPGLLGCLRISMDAQPGSSHQHAARPRAWPLLQLLRWLGDRTWVGFWTDTWLISLGPCDLGACIELSVLLTQINQHAEAAATYL